MSVGGAGQAPRHFPKDQLADNSHEFLPRLIIAHNLDDLLFLWLADSPSPYDLVIHEKCPFTTTLVSLQNISSHPVLFRTLSLSLSLSLSNSSDLFLSTLCCNLSTLTHVHSSHDHYTKNIFLTIIVCKHKKNLLMFFFIIILW